MNSQRFDWKRADKTSAALELQKRNYCRNIQKDSQYNCCICGKKPKKGDYQYQPEKGFNSQRTMIVAGHKECIDRHCAEFKAKSSVAAHSMTNDISSEPKVRSLKYQTTIDANPIDALRALSSKELMDRISSGLTSGINKNAEQEAYERGCRDTLARVAALLQELGIEI